MIAIILGAPGAGKGTQAAVAAQRLGLAHIATGDLLREEAKKGSELGAKAKGFMERGELVPDDVVVAMVVGRLEEARGGAILDGFPRTLVQAKALDAQAAAHRLRVDRAVYLEVSRPELIRRLTGRWECGNCRTPYHTESSPPKVSGVCDRCGGQLLQRPDDRPETVQKRLTVYLELTRPVIDYYRDKGVLAEVNGEQPIEAVTKRVIAALQQAGLGVPLEA